MKKRIVIFQTTEQLVKGLESLINKGQYGNRTEALNDAIRHLMEKYNNNNSTMSKVRKK